MHSSGRFDFDAPGACVPVRVRAACVLVLLIQRGLVAFSPPAQKF